MTQALIIPLIYGALLIIASCDIDRSPKLATWNGGKITERDLTQLQTINPSLGDRLKEGPIRERAVEDLVNRELLYQEARSRGLDRRRDLKVKKEWVAKTLVIQNLLDEEATARARKYYEDNKETEFKDVLFEDAKSGLILKFRREASQDLTNQLRTKAQVQVVAKPKPPPSPETAPTPAPDSSSAP